jgi:hypothetical protein
MELSSRPTCLNEKLDARSKLSVIEELDRNTTLFSDSPAPRDFLITETFDPKLVKYRHDIVEPSAEKCKVDTQLESAAAHRKLMLLPKLTHFKVDSIDAPYENARTDILDSSEVESNSENALPCMTAWVDLPWDTLLPQALILMAIRVALRTLKDDPSLIKFRDDTTSLTGNVRRILKLDPILHMPPIILRDLDN